MIVLLQTYVISHRVTITEIVDANFNMAYNISQDSEIEMTLRRV